MTQRVMIGGEESSRRPEVNAIPQGSTLIWPTLIQHFYQQPGQMNRMRPEQVC